MAPLPPLKTQCAGLYIPTGIYDRADSAPSKSCMCNFRGHKILLANAAVKDGNNRTGQGHSLGAHLEEQTVSNSQECKRQVTAIQE